jgi:hypothetical protein
MSGARHRRKGDRIEREVVDRHKALGIHAERYPLSGASRFRGSGHDLDLYVFGREKAPAVAEVKGRKNGAGFTTLERRIRCAVSSPQQYRSARAPTLAHVGPPARTGAAMTPAVCEHASRQLQVLALRSLELADRVAAGEIAFLDAVDVAYEAAMWSSLTSTVGDDIVQATLAAAFANARRPT